MFFSGSSFGRKCLWGCGSGRCCFCLLPTVPPHWHTPSHTRTHTSRTHTDVQRFSAFQYFHFCLLCCWLKIFSVKNVEKSKTTKTADNNNNNKKKKNMVRPRRPPVFHNFSSLFIYTIRYIFVFMCRSPTDLRFASATITHRDSYSRLRLCCMSSFFFVYPSPHIFMSFPRWFSRIFTKFSTQFRRVLSQQTKQITI